MYRMISRVFLFFGVLGLAIALSFNTSSVARAAVAIPIPLPFCLSCTVVEVRFVGALAGRGRGVLGDALADNRELLM